MKEIIKVMEAAGRRISDLELEIDLLKWQKEELEKERNQLLEEREARHV